MELIEGSETSSVSTVTVGNYPKENILQELELYGKNKLFLNKYSIASYETCNLLFGRLE